MMEGFVMRAMVLEKLGEPLVLRDVSRPEPGPYEVLIKIMACGVCRTDVHIVDGELHAPHLPLILGHQIVGIIEKCGEKVTKYQSGERVGVPWLGGSCLHCEFCLSGRENLCDHGVFTGYSRNGGFAEYCTAHEDYIIPLPEDYDDLHMAPFLCAGLIGYRALRLAEPCKSIGFYGFGSSAHLILQVAQALGKKVYVFTRSGDTEKQALAISLGAKWAGGSDQMPPELLDAAIIFAPVGELYVQALKVIKKGGRVVSAGIHMSDIPSFPYELLWGERVMTSVTNLTRQDGIEFFTLIKKMHVNSIINIFDLKDANEALAAIRDGAVDGSVVLKINH